MKKLLKIALAHLGYHVQNTRYYPRQLLNPVSLRVVEFDDVVCRRMFECEPKFTFIQIGAFDGITKDPLRKYIDKCGWTGVVVEPQARAASQLRELYRGNDRIVILETAVYGQSGKRTLFTLDSKVAPPWAGVLASFQRETILKHSALIPGIERMILEESVDCITFDDVLGYLQPQAIDLLQIDTEGADGYLLSIFPFERSRPAIIHWEVKHLSKKEKEACLERLANFGYKFAASGGEDMLAVLESSAQNEIAA